MTWHEAHGDFAWVLMGLNAVAGVLCVGAHYRDALRHKAVWVFVVIAQASVFVQVALGVAVQNQMEVKAQDLHVLYGFSAIIAIAILYGYRSTSPWVKQREYLVYGLGSFFIMGLGIRELFLA